MKAIGIGIAAGLTTILINGMAGVYGYRMGFITWILVYVVSYVLLKYTWKKINENGGEKHAGQKDDSGKDG